MPPLEKPAFEALIARGCGCGRHDLRVHAIAAGVVETLEGDVVSPVRWTYDGSTLPARAYRIDCGACGAVLFARDDCPLCAAPGGLQRALAAQHGLPLLRACPRCGDAELVLTVEQRLRAELLHGRLSRRVAEGEPHEGGFHVVEARCQSCEDVVARAGDARCVACGRSSLLRRR